MTNKDLKKLIENFSNSLDTGVLKMEEMISNYPPHTLSEDVIKITILHEEIASKNDEIQDILDKDKELEGSARRITQIHKEDKILHRKWIRKAFKEVQND